MRRHYWIEHLPGKPLDATQFCRRCGALLIDYHNTMTGPKSTGPHFWDEHCPVYHWGGIWTTLPRLEKDVIPCHRSYIS